ncbi:YggS family pyridoxal phosphate-dependent enzyme [Pelosinus sp. sgz500959]|uniref:YggS family pyridoxal phosphate-dependent enzyme n=1 Tax=Pelosinus sp. sgz500959 TaxID=3242472 RepID=UPI00366C3B83
MFVTENLTKIMENINHAITRANQINMIKLDDVKLVAVTKNHSVLTIEKAIAAGVVAIGENRIQEALDKSLTLTGKVEWQLIGHLQTNKVRQAVSLFDMIQSVDSERLAIEINRVAKKINKRQDILMQINVANEDTKFGISAKEVMPLARVISNLENVRLCGLMTVAPFYENTELTRPIFREMYQLFMGLKEANLPNTSIEWLSMGMTNDYSVAIEEGSNLVRIGTGIFGQREY